MADKKQPPKSGPIDVVWLCGMEDDCLNLQEKGKHRGDYGYLDAQTCVHQFEPNALKNLHQY
jgi:hypothetical protein